MFYDFDGYVFIGMITQNDPDLFFSGAFRQGAAIRLNPFASQIESPTERQIDPFISGQIFDTIFPDE